MGEHDLGLGHDLRVMSRRRALGFLGVAGVAAAAAGCATSSDSSGSSTSTAGATSSATSATPAAAPEETAGPYPGDGSNGPNVLIESGVVRSDITTSFGAYSGTAQGVPMTLTLNLRDLVKNVAGTGMAVYVWHCDREGRYSLYTEGATEQNYLRGVQVADDDGTVRFTSIFPACYAGRWPHIHFEVYDSLTTAVAGDNARLTSQIALPQDACTTVFEADSGYADSIRNMSGVTLASDGVFGDGWDAELATVTGTPTTTMSVSLTVGVAAKSQNTQSDNGFPGPPPSGNGAPGGPPPSGGAPSGPPPGGSAPR
ncbi:dioxygenase [Nocardia alba]|uniref:Dioxygenase-like protein n=1 Tax=Nocardia alba TaxID=225051 RepID=A0A4R1G2T2_9NOCA|nr:dioxygenase [Nocardia alba]TCJ99388.1 dioxygenase-like protein [Nocardia alba]